MPDYYTEEMQSICKIDMRTQFSPTALRHSVKEYFKGWYFSSEKEKEKTIVWSNIESKSHRSETEEAKINFDSFESRHSCLFRNFFEHDLTEFTHHYI
jgi:hypothetical protein